MKKIRVIFVFFSFLLIFSGCSSEDRKLADFFESERRSLSIAINNVINALDLRNYEPEEFQ